MKFVFALLLCLLGSAAHALQVSPVEGYEVRSKKVTDYGDLELPVSCAKPTCALKAQIEKNRFRLEGKIEKLQVHHRSGARLSPPQVAREYLTSLKKVGGELMNPESGENGAFVYKVPEGANTVWVILDDNFDGYYTLYVVTPQARDSSVVVKAGELAAALQGEGIATVYIEFDTGRATLKPEGGAAIDEMVKLLQQQPKLRLSVEGHTDNQGDAWANLKLSQDRAQAVVAALEAKGITKGRLAAKGHGQTVPVADNRNEAGRAKNRRVELVKLP